jgi:hypothetical protein
MKTITQEKKEKLIKLYLEDILLDIGIDRPENWDKVERYVIKDVEETADKDNWTSGDVVIAFRRWIESRK